MRGSLTTRRRANEFRPVYGHRLHTSHGPFHHFFTYTKSPGCLWAFLLPSNVWRIARSGYLRRSIAEPRTIYGKRTVARMLQNRAGNHTPQGIVGEAIIPQTGANQTL